MTLGYGFVGVSAVLLAVGVALAWLLARRTAAMRDAEERCARALQDAKDAQEALLESQKRYERVVVSSQAGFWDWDVLNDRYYASPRLLEMVGLPSGTTVTDRGEFLRRAPIDPEDREHWQEAVEKLFASGGSRVTMDLRSFRDGETVWSQFDGTCFRDNAGRVVRWTGSVTDITQRKRVENALRSSEQRYALAMEAASDGYTDWDFVTGEFYISPRLLKIIGHPPDATFTGRDDWVRRFPFHPEDRKRWEAAVAAHFASQDAKFKMDLRIVVSGETRWLAFTFIATRDAAGRVVRWTGAIADINEAKRDVAALLDAIPGLVAILAPSGEVDAVNSQLIGYCGQPLEAMKQWGTNGIVHSEDLPRIVPLFMRAISTGEPYAFEARIRRFDGAYCWHEVRGLPFRDSSGQIVRWYVLLSDTDARARAEEELRLSEERYALAMEASEEGHFDWNVQTGEIFASEHLRQMLDLPADTGHRTPGELIAAGIPFHPDDSQRIRDMTRDVLAGVALHHEFEYRLLRGQLRELRWIHSRWKIFRDAQGVAQRVIGVVSDITERKRAEDQLRESEARFRGLTALWSDWYWRQDEQLRFTYSSAAIEPPPGHPGGSAIGKTRWELPGIVPLSSSWAEHREVLAAHKPFRDFEYSRPAFDGTLRYISTSGTPIFDEKGGFNGYHGVGRDITDRKRAEEELRSRQEMLDLAQASARAIAFEWKIGEGEGENRWSPELEAMYGIPAGSFDGTYESWRKLVHAEDWANLRAAVETASESGDVDIEYRVIQPGGANRWLQAKGRMLLDAQGRPERVLGFMFDVTDRHVAQEELQRMERELRQAQRLEALGTLAGGIAHDFNNILGAIIGYGEMALREAEKGSRLYRDLDTMMAAGERGRALVDRILAFSRSGVGESALVHVEAVVREALDQVAARLPENVSIHPRLRAGRAAMLGDSTQVHQVVMNLTSNAVQAMPRGGILRVELATAHVDAARRATVGAIAPRDYVVLSVSDTGTGIAPDVLERMFDPFFTTKDVGVGTGLGLSLVHGIVTSVGGAIDVVSELGKGSTFSVYLPRTGEAAESSVDEDQPIPRGDGERVLIVEDEEPLMRLASEALRELGYAPVGFTSSTAALDAFRADPLRFDAVLTDERMPGMSGSALIRAVRGIRDAMPVVLMSGYLGMQSVDADVVVRKPLSMRELAASIARALRA